MSPVPVRNQPAFRAVVLGVLLAATWGYDYVRSGYWQGSVYGAGLDLLLLLLLGLVCLFFFAQFTLPIKTLTNRMRLAGRLWLHAWGAHGAALFVRNGRKVERQGEAGRAGPGVIWIDTASAALTRTAAGPRQALGPGIHFVENGERIEKTFSLHIQACTVGPGQDEPIFERLEEGASEDERARHDSAEVLRRAVSGLTRDGNEVVPEIRVTFKLDGEPAGLGQAGSHFGFSREAVERAAHGEGLTVDPSTSRRAGVAWNQLPGLIAVDLWREYLAKFTLDDLFTPRFGAVPDVLQPEEPAPIIMPDARLSEIPRGRAARLIRRWNSSLERRMATGPGNDESGGVGVAPSPRSARHRPMLPGKDYTALQVIKHMVWARMALAAVPILDESGRYGTGHVLSEEFKRLRERGLRVLDVTIGGFRFAPAVEDQIVKHWQTTWLEAAAGERMHVEQLEALAGEAGGQRALLDHARTLGKALRAEPESTVPALLKALLLASHTEILTDEHLHGKGGEELLAISGLTKWLESTNDD